MDDFRNTVLQRPRADSRTSQEDRDRERERDSRIPDHRDSSRRDLEHDYDDRDRDRRARDILNPSPYPLSSPGQQQHHHHHPPHPHPPLHHTQQQPPAPTPPSIHHLTHPHHSGHHQNHHASPPPRSDFAYSGSGAMSAHQPGPGSPSAPSGGPVAPRLPPPPTAGLAPPPGASSAAGPPGVSPLHPPSAYYPPTGAGAAAAHHHDASRDANRDPPGSSHGGRSSFYDPTTDSTKERRVSDTWHSAPQAQTPKSREPYAYGQPEPPSYYNGTYTSPRSANYTRPRSPVSHSHPNPPAGSLSPPGRSVQMSSPSSRYNAPAPTMGSLSNGSGLGHSAKSDLAPLSPTKPAASTPSRSADPMSFSNILSSAEPSKPREPSPVPVREPEVERQPKIEPGTEVRDKEILDHDDETEPEPAPIRESSAAPKKKAKRAPKGRASDIREQATKGRRASLKRESPSEAGSVPAKRAKSSWTPQFEERIAKREKEIDREANKFDVAEFDRDEYQERAAKRRKYFEDKDSDISRLRRDHLAETVGRKLSDHAECGRRRYDEVCYDAAHNEVRDQELHAEKERKKDMQRKRRREKSMAATLEQKEAALARAEAAEDDTERQKHLRDAERASKKAQQTKHILQKGIKGPARNVDVSMEGGGTMSSFQASDIESTAGAPTGKKSKSNKSGNRPKKSKEQKNAEKASAEAAQAAIDAGEELPARDEGKVRIKINTKGKKKDAKDKLKDQDADKTETDLEADKENKPSKQDKADDVPDLEKRFISKGYNQIYDQILRDVARKDVNKTYRLATDSVATKASNLKKTAVLASKEAKRWQARTNKGTKDLQARAKRVMRDMMGFWKRNEREERDLRKAAEKQELENARKEEADREAARQKRKLNFLISQTELYSHFIGKKIKTDEVERSTDNPDIAPAADDPGQKKLDVAEPPAVAGKVTNFENLDFDDEDETNLQAAAMANAQNAIAEAQKKAHDFNKQDQDLDMDEEGEMNFQNPAGMGDVEIEQPKLLDCQLKEYQLKGLNWLVNLYEQGINGILADEMGLGKTVQSISVMAYLAEKHDIWGPFLVVAPASTLHNWQQEIAKFVPEFKILPYWGSAPDRKILRKFWDRKHSTYRKEANFHVCVTSYQLVVSDVAYFQKMKWQYMILDEAQAIKSSQSSRWKSLLGFHCRNRLLLTGTPIQNNMQELWALLHFIMPSLFDSHDEFSEWFSKDIESHAQSNTKLNEDQLKRLHMILKPFMLRRVKKHVQKELGDKIEKDVFCDLTYRQRAYYDKLKDQINIMDLVEKATMGNEQDSGTLLNLVMQFRKVCNHPDLFERAEVSSAFSFGYFAETASFVREGNNVPVGYSTRNLIEYNLPARVWAEGGRLHKAGRDNQTAGWRNKALGHMMNIFSPEHIVENQSADKGFSWLRFADVSASEVYQASHSSLFDRAATEVQKSKRLGYLNVAYDDPEDENYTPAHAMLKICERQNRKPLADITREGVLGNLMNVAGQSYFDSGLGRLEQAGRPQASAPPVEVSCNSRSAIIEREKTLFNVPMRKTLYGPALWEEQALVENKVPLERYPPVKMLPEPDHEKRKFTNIGVPSMRRFVTDSGKLAKLDQLLFELKNGGHRVLLYFQMTRMIDMMEEYLTYRNYKYCRLDGSTKLEDRRDTVHDFQTRPEIFVFLLSTRAGGLGINLTSADTVIFYDSDWNPTIDSQAMDRAHRLGQTKQVTVYRLITSRTIEERIRKRALQKEEVQRVVIQGGGASVDFSGRRAPENRNRDIAMWLADDDQAEMIEKREKELAESGELEKQKKKGGKKSKKAEQAASLEELYHEGEGHFDDASKQQSGTATPAEPEVKKRAKKGTKRAKTAKQRLAIADGEV